MASSGSTLSGTTGASGATTVVADDTGTTAGADDMDTTGVVFLIGPDGGGVAFECDLFAQDCRPGEKCTAWANDGGNVWNATKCVPVVDEPAGVGEPCHMEGSVVSGIDDCDFGAMCFNVDRETLEGVCTPFCVGDESSPYCEDPDRYCPIAGDGAIILCLPRCDPVEQDCPAGQACYPIQSAWLCALDASGRDGAYGDPCLFVNGCEPGLACLGNAAVPPGLPCEGTPGCCTEVCDLTDPLGDAQCAGAAGGQTCQAWYGEGAETPAGYEHVGVCAMP